MRYGNTEIPEWLEIQLKQMSPEPHFNQLFELLLIDYIKRNEPKPETVNSGGVVFDLTSVRLIKDANVSLDEIADLVEQNQNNFGQSGAQLIKDHVEQRQILAQLNKDITLGDSSKDELDSMDVYLEKGAEIIGLHAVGYCGPYNYTCEDIDGNRTTHSSDFQVEEAWGNNYDEQYNMLEKGSFRLHTYDLQEYARDLEAEGWVRRKAPKKGLKMKKLKVAVGIHGTVVFLEKFPDDEEHQELNEMLKDVEDNCDFPEEPGIYQAELAMVDNNPRDPEDYEAYLDIIKLEKI